ncbi:prolipoprotein diacylglyceryl transferase [Virgibacillus phasianinus]|uniref:Phosphatidylglycerol--prolipoprotein diacylglyceryl transferase n=1 Tax=Virgibacillus phasianinus TaxID=2017483 RepID=A0A220U0B7_9BACI|nr:prolipoprotein diacylglyceryl transferase [Virgibacillus phasianinus]ASK61311.1 prolipoprotein diacylglyceryl transferase [Virgibacillus phasianinus]
MIPVISLGPITIYFFGFMIAVGALIGLLLLIREAKKRGMDHKLLIDVAIYSLLGGVIGARIVYVVVYDPAYYIANPMEILFIQNGGLSIHGGVLGGLVIGYFLLRRHKLPIWHTLDIVAPALILAQGISRIGCDVFGEPMSSALPWGIERYGEILHPAQAYEFLLDFLLFGYLWLKLKKTSYTGQIFIHYLIGYMIIRGIVEFARINPMVVGPFSVSHVMSLIGIIIAISLMRYRKANGLTDKITPIPKKDIIKTVMFVLSMMVISLLLFYGVQG